MKPLYRNFIIGFVIFVVAASFLSVRFYAAAGQFTTLTAAMQVPASCGVLPSAPGPEDIVIDHERGIAFVSAVDRRAYSAGNLEVRGGIYAIDLQGDPASWALRPVTPHVPVAFQPHGLGLHVSASGERTLTVINHAEGVETVELFDIAQDGVLSHRASVRDPLFISLNDVQPVGPTRFYATNDHGTASPFWGAVHDFLGMARANLVYFDGSNARVVVDDLKYANGVNVSPDGSQIYVAELGDMVLRIYNRDASSGDLLPFDYIVLGTGVDNIDVNPDGTLLIAAHPKLMDFVAHAGDEAEISPSQVVRLVPREGGGGTGDTVYLNLGQELSGSSVAVAYGDKMLIAGVFDPRILVCTLPPRRAE